MLGGVSLLKNLAPLLVEIHPRADRKRLARIKVTRLPETDFRFTPEFRGLAGNSIVIRDFPANQLSVLMGNLVGEVAVKRVMRCQSLAWWLRQCCKPRLLPFVSGRQNVFLRHGC